MDHGAAAEIICSGNPWSEPGTLQEVSTSLCTVALSPEQEKQALQEFKAIVDPSSHLKRQLKSCALTVEQFALYYMNNKLLRTTSSAATAAAVHSPAKKRNPRTTSI